MTSLACCSGVVHTGTPTGEETVIEEIPCYVKKSDKHPERAIVIATDVFGYKIPNVRLIADKFSDALECTVFVPDSLDNHPADPVLFDQVRQLEGAPLWSKIYHGIFMAMRFIPFLWNNSFNKSCKILKKFIAAIRAQGYQKIGLQGYCWGGKMGLMLVNPAQLDETYTSLIQAACMAHPGGVSFPSDIDAIAVPSALVLAGDDMELNASKQEQLQQLASKKNFVAVHLYPQCHHGFAVRGAEDVPLIVQARQDALEKAILLFKAHL